MVGSLYVSSPDMWYDFYKQLNAGKVKIPKYKRRQKGNGIGGMYTHKRYMISVPKRDKVVVGKQVTPVAAALERAKSQLRTAIKENRPHIPVTDNTGPSIQAPVLNGQSTYEYKTRYATKRKRPSYDSIWVTDGAPPGIRASKKKRSR